jgi:hypothetical protein
MSGEWISENQAISDFSVKNFLTGGTLSFTEN